MDLDELRHLAASDRLARAMREHAGEVARGDRVSRTTSLRFDLADNPTRESLGLDAPVRHSNGWVDVWGVATRTGVFQYADEQGAPFFELRPPEEVLDEASLATVDGIPFTLDHPPEMVDAATARDLVHGWILEKTVLGEGLDSLVATRIRIATADALGVIEGGTVELSMGYTAILDHSPGQTEGGESFDAVQRSIRYNHLALVDLARAGPVARLHLDGREARRGFPTMHKIKITHATGEFEFTDSAALSRAALLIPGLRTQARKVSETERTDLSTGEITIALEGEEPATLVLPMATVESVLAMLGAAPEMEAPAEEEPAAEEVAPMEEAASEAPIAAAGDEEEEPTSHGDQSLDLDEFEARILAKADARARDRAETERKAASVLADGFAWGEHSTAQIKAEAVASVHADKADEARALAAAAEAGDQRKAGHLDAMFDRAIEDSKAARNDAGQALAAALLDPGEGESLVAQAQKKRADRIAAPPKDPAAAE